MTSKVEIGQRFNKLVFLGIAETARGKGNHIRGLWRCDCGKTREAALTRVINGSTKSCGCLARVGRLPTHGMHNSPEYRSWSAMLTRCHNQNAKDFPRYGGRGIVVCQEWRASFQAFFDYLGPRPPGTTLDRIDGEKSYEPGNVRWATPTAQARNRRNTVIVETPRGRLDLVDYARLIGITADAALLRLRRGKLIGCTQVQQP